MLGSLSIKPLVLSDGTAPYTSPIYVTWTGILFIENPLMMLAQGLTTLLPHVKSFLVETTLSSLKTDLDSSERMYRQT